MDVQHPPMWRPYILRNIKVPESYAEGNGDMLTYSPTSAFWVFNRVAHFAYHRYDIVMHDVKALQEELETKFADILV
ncbi:MAG: hypothetical protein H6536_02795 [Bacteroidales bacterium]|nr:hypothetical protein [Bacteroidales bacterium]